MKLVNFKTGGQGIDLVWPDGGYADLHNDFDFTSIHYEPATARVTLEWAKSLGRWASRVDITRLRMLFTGVTFWWVKERDPAYPLSEDTCLSEFGWLPQTARDDFDSFCLEQDEQLSYDLLLRFQSEWAIKLNAESVELQVMYR